MLGKKDQLDRIKKGDQKIKRMVKRKDGTPKKFYSLAPPKGGFERKGIKKLKVVYSKEQPRKPVEDMAISCKTNCVCPLFPFQSVFFPTI